MVDPTRPYKLMLAGGQLHTCVSVSTIPALAAPLLCSHARVSTASLCMQL